MAFLSAGAKHLCPIVRLEIPGPGRLHRLLLRFCGKKLAQILLLVFFLVFVIVYSAVLVVP